MSIDMIELEKYILPVKGVVKLELFDALTGKKKEEVVGNNFLSVGLVGRVMRQVQKFVFGAQNPNQRALFGSRNINFRVPSSNGWFNYLVLTDSDMAESPYTETNIPGNIVGYADRFPYSGTDSKKGAINQSESYVDEERCRWVMDFATDRANGTIQSICWAFSNSVNGYIDDGLGFDYEGVVTFGISDSSGNGCAAIYSDGYYWVANIGYNTVTRVDPSSGAQTQFSVGASIDKWNGFWVSGSYIYFVRGSNSSYLCRYDMVNKTLNSSWANLGNSTYYGLVCDGARLYAVGSNNSTQLWIRPVRISDGVVETLRTYNMSTTINWYSYGNIFYNEEDNCIYLRPITSVKGGFTRVDLTDNTLLEVAAGDDTLFQFSGFLFRKDGEYYASNYNKFDYFYNSEYAYARYGVYKVNSFRTYNLLSRKRLDAPVIKTSSKTMKITYDFIFN